MRRTVLAMLGVFGGLALVVAISLIVLIRLRSEPLPVGNAGPAAESLADRIEAAVGVGAFRRTGAVAFTFRGENRHFCDLRRGFSEVRWEASGDEWMVQFDRKTGMSVVTRNENPLADANRRAVAHREAIKKHVNDFFWLNPFNALRAPGVERLLVGERALLVNFRSGGVTPGDSYLIVTDRAFRPESVRMWVKALPIPGMRFSFEGWKKMPPGFEVSLKHRSDFAEVNLTDVISLPEYPEPGKVDRFNALVRQLEKGAASGRR